MEISNATRSDTQYRSDSGYSPKLTYAGEGSGAILVPSGSTVEIPDPVCPFAVEFVVAGHVVTYLVDRPLQRIVLVQVGDKYQIRRYKRPRRPLSRKPRRAVQLRRSRAGSARA